MAGRRTHASRCISRQPRSRDKHGDELLRTITQQAIRPNSFTSVRDLITAIENLIDSWNDRSHPFTLDQTADELLPHCRPGKRTSSTRH